MQVKSNPDKIFRINGIGPKALADITNLVETLEAEMIPAEVEVEEPVTVEVIQPEGIDAVEVIETVEEPVALEPEVAVPVVEEAAAEVDFVEEFTSLDEIFTLKPEMLEGTKAVEEEDESGTAGQKAEAGKKKKKVHKEVEYDPDRDLTYARKKHKKGDEGEWDW